MKLYVLQRKIPEYTMILGIYEDRAVALRQKAIAEEFVEDRRQKGGLNYRPTYTVTVHDLVASTRVLGLVPGNEVPYTPEAEEVME